MSKKIEFLIITILAILLPLNVKADCQSDYKKIEDQFKASYKYNKDSDSFTITFVSPNYDRYMFQMITAEDIRNADFVTLGKQLTVTLKNYKGSEYRYQIIAEYPECKDVSVYKSKLILKKYNAYADNSLCKGNEEFVLCQKDYEGELDDKTFQARIDAYIEEKNSKEAEKVKKSDVKNTNETIIEKTSSFIEENTFLIIVVAIFIIALIIFTAIMIKNKMKSRRLE